MPPFPPATYLVTVSMASTVRMFDQDVDCEAGWAVSVRRQQGEEGGQR